MEPTLTVDPAAEVAGETRPALPRGATLDRYVVLKPLGTGGMGVVYSAFDPELDRRVALKVVHPQRMAARSGRRTQRRLAREAQALAQLNHPNVLAVHDVGMVGGQLYVATELVDGCDLSTWLSRANRRRSEILDVFLQAGAGLAAAHAAGLVHRDFKLSNVMVGRDGRVRVVDFGLASRDPALDGAEVLASPVDP
ncbi:MAG: serine/threonine-protein kinase, partial [Acidobacteriota bacterium]